MAKRLKLQCWNCPKVYFYPLEETSLWEIIVSCPYCRAEAVVDLRREPKTTEEVFRGDTGSDWSLDEDEDILPTRKPM